MDVEIKKKDVLEKNALEDAKQLSLTMETFLREEGLGSCPVEEGMLNSMMDQLMMEKLMMKQQLLLSRLL